MTRPPPLPEGRRGSSITVRTMGYYVLAARNEGAKVGVEICDRGENHRWSVMLGSTFKHRGVTPSVVLAT